MAQESLIQKILHVLPPNFGLRSLNGIRYIITMQLLDYLKLGKFVDQILTINKKHDNYKTNMQ